MCHFHIGYDNHNRLTSIELIKVLDLFLGVPSILIDKDTCRRELYGKAGCFRFTSYGLEYRTLSGYFIDSPELIGWCFDQICAAIDFYNAGNTIDPADEADIIRCINQDNKEIAQMLTEKYKINLI